MIILAIRNTWEYVFLITDILGGIRGKAVLKTSADYIVRDYLGPQDMYQLISRILDNTATNTAIDCHTRAPIDKPTLLEAMKQNFGLRFEASEEAASINVTGIKPHYYSLNRKAKNFGYSPSLTSLEGVLKEMSSVLIN